MSLCEAFLCECGCGNPAPIALMTNARRGHVRGKPVRFIAGHNRVPGGSGNPDNYVIHDDGCWLWRGAVDTSGYGTLTLPEKQRASAHRYQYEKARGPIPAGMDLHHTCGVRRCVNPEHLEVLTKLEHARAGGKLTMEKAREIRRRSSEGESTAGLARDYGVAWKTASDLLRGRTWRETHDVVLSLETVVDALMVAESDPREMPGDYAQVARWLERRFGGA